MNFSAILPLRFSAALRGEHLYGKRVVWKPMALLWVFEGTENIRVFGVPQNRLGVE